MLREELARVDEDCGPLALLRIGVVRPELGVELVPDCGCDACDSGAANLLHLVDDTISAVIGGPFVLLRGAAGKRSGTRTAHRRA